MLKSRSFHAVILMKNKYKELAENIGVIVSLVKDFELTKNDYKKPDIRAYQVKISNLANIIGGLVKEDTEKLNYYIDAYLSVSNKEKLASLIDKAINLTNDLWEL